MKKRWWHCLVLGAGLAAAAHPGLAVEEPWRIIYPEQRRMEIREPSQIAPAPLLLVPRPDTVSDGERRDAPTWELSLDEAIRIALENAEAVRVLAGVTATTSGRTIYDPAITNTRVDQERARFDPTVSVDNIWSRTDLPQAVLTPPAGPGLPPGAAITGLSVENFTTSPQINKQLVGGGNLFFGANVIQQRVEGSVAPLNPQTTATPQLGVTQPLLQGFGPRVNLAPIVIAKVDTERSFFDLKDSVQELVRSVIEAYWNLVFAQTDVWARERQVEQGEEALDVARARLDSGRGDARDVAQARTALAGFRANLVASQGNLLNLEAAVRNLLGLPPTDTRRIVPNSPMTARKLETNWESMLALAGEYRPDLIQLKLIIEADEQRLLISRNQALPRVDASALYRWNGLSGRTPDQMILSTVPGQFADWQFGVHFAVPLGLRQSRAALRQQELLLAKDRANLRQGMHAATHTLALNYRNLSQYYEQYLAFGRAKEAARLNIDAQFGRVGAGGINRAGGQVIYLNVLQSISDWGNSVSSEARALAQYNTELATLERQTGTILESHGVRFAEERYRSIGPLGRLFDDRYYPLDRRPTPNAERYPPGEVPDLDKLEMPRRPSRPYTPLETEELDRLPPASAAPPNAERPSPGDSSK